MESPNNKVYEYYVKHMHLVVVDGELADEVKDLKPLFDYRIPSEVVSSITVPKTDFMNFLRKNQIPPSALLQESQEIKADLGHVWNNYITRYIIHASKMFEKYDHFKLEIMSEGSLRFGSPQSKSSVYIVSFNQEWKYETIESVPSSVIPAVEMLCLAKGVNKFVNTKAQEKANEEILTFEMNFTINGECYSLSWCSNDLTKEKFETSFLSQSEPLVLKMLSKTNIWN